MDFEKPSGNGDDVPPQESAAEQDPEEIPSREKIMEGFLHADKI